MILKACPECHRQYDVTQLSPGSRVRCVCSHLLTVPTVRELAVQARKCTNCGGKVSPGDEACAYCGCELSKADLQRSTLCPQCFTRLADDARHCKSCGVAIDPQALTPLPEGKSCPRCKGGRGGLGIRSLPSGSVVECQACEGIWITTETFQKVCALAQNRPEIQLTRGLQPIAAGEPERKVIYIPCLTCDELMQRRMFRYKNQASRVIIDFCRNHGVWLDKQELERIVAFIRERVDVELPFDTNEALTGRRSRRGPDLILEGPGWKSDMGSLGTYLALDALGDVLGGVLAGIFD